MKITIHGDHIMKCKNGVEILMDGRKPLTVMVRKTTKTYETLEVGGMSHSFNSYEEMMNYYKGFPEGTWQYIIKEWKEIK